MAGHTKTHTQQLQGMITPQDLKISWQLLWQLLVVVMVVMLISTQVLHHCANGGSELCTGSSCCTELRAQSLHQHSTPGRQRGQLSR